MITILTSQKKTELPVINCLFCFFNGFHTNHGTAHTTFEYYHIYAISHRHFSSIVSLDEDRDSKNVIDIDCTMWTSSLSHVTTSQFLRASDNMIILCEMFVWLGVEMCHSCKNNPLKIFQICDTIKWNGIFFFMKFKRKEEKIIRIKKQSNQPAIIWVTQFRVENHHLI